MFAAARTGVQGLGHPPADAPFEERLAPYQGLVDSFLQHSAAQLSGNVDVSFMKADFERFVAERMLLAGMGALLASNAGATRCSQLIEQLVDMAEQQRAPRQSSFRGPSLQGPMHEAIRDHASMIPGAFQAP